MTTALVLAFIATWLVIAEVTLLMLLASCRGDTDPRIADGLQYADEHPFRSRARWYVLWPYAVFHLAVDR